ncbi:MAG: VOC family protein [Planctomycetota bacterium]
MDLGFAHVCIKTGDLGATERFYTGVLGLEKVFNFCRDGKPCGFYLRISDRQFIEVFDDGGVENRRPAIAHICLETHDLDLALGELKAHGIATTDKKLGCDKSYQTWFKDPNGIDIELHEYTDRSAQLTGEDVSVDW